MADFKVMFSKIADDLPQVVNPETGEYFGVEDYWWAFLINEDNQTSWDDNGGYCYNFGLRQDAQENVYYVSHILYGLYFIPTIAYVGQDNIKLEKGLYIATSELDSKQCYAVRLIDINTGDGPK